MFDENTKEPEDIFAAEDNNQPPNQFSPVLKPSQPNLSAQVDPQSATNLSTQSSVPNDIVTHGPSRTLMILLVIIVFLLLAGMVTIVYIWMSRQGTAELTQTPSTLTNDLLNGLNQQALPVVPTPLLGETEPLPTGPIDTDRDGLTDEEEAVLGTNPTLWDTDGDGLSDYDEVYIWGTDPLNPDTDGDGYPDGVEVRAGFDPLDPTPGALLLVLPPDANGVEANDSENNTVESTI